MNQESEKPILESASLKSRQAPSSESINPTNLEETELSLTPSKLANQNMTFTAVSGKSTNAKCIKEVARESIDKLIQLIDEKRVSSIQDSIETLQLDKSVLNLNIKSIDGVADLLYSEEIYDCEQEIGIEMPVDRLCKISHSTIALIGASGCGKTRTCFDWCRHYWGLYFDCTANVDFFQMIRDLERIRTWIKTGSAQQKFEKESQKLIACLIAARILVLKTLRERNPDLKCFEWLLIQRSRHAQLLFTNIFGKLSRLPELVSFEIYQQMKEWFPRDGRIIVDASHYLFNVLHLDYRSVKQRDITTDGQFAHPRSFFSFLSEFIIESGLKSIWCGTRMRQAKQVFTSMVSTLERQESKTLEHPEAIWNYELWIKGIKLENLRH